MQWDESMMKTADSVRTFFTLLAIGAALLLLAAETPPPEAGRLTGHITDAQGRPLKEAVVFVDGLTAGAPPSKPVVLSQRNGAFTPHVLAIMIGTKVRFPNDDEVFHNVFAYYEAKRFDLGLYPPGSEKTVAFDKLGPVALFCNIHAGMNAYIYVVPNPYFAVTDKKGAFSIAGIPAGSQRVKVWHEAHKEATKSVTIRTGQTDTLDARLEKR